MSKRIAKNTHWMPKTGSYTIRLNRRGDIGETRPVGAKDETYDQIRERGNRIQAECEAIDNELRFLRGDDKRAPLIKRKIQLEADLRNIRFDKFNAYFPLYRDAFLAAARMMLDEETLKRIENYVVTKVGMPPKHWQRFMGDNGFGKTDTTTYR